MKKGTIIAIGFGAATAVAAMLYLKLRKEEEEKIQRYQVSFDDEEINEETDENLCENL